MLSGTLIRREVISWSAPSASKSFAQNIAVGLRAAGSSATLAAAHRPTGPPRRAMPQSRRRADRRRFARPPLAPGPRRPGGRPRAGLQVGLDSLLRSAAGAEPLRAV